MSVGWKGPVEKSFFFGSFRLCAESRSLTRDGRPIKLSLRGIEILLALVERAGEVVDKADIFNRAWPGLTVEESNLRVHIRALRRVLGVAEDGRPYILNISGRGYSFAGRVAPTSTGLESPRQNKAHLGATVLGRRADIVAACEQFTTARLVTLTGPGGVGKTKLAELVAKRLGENRGYPIYFVRLASVELPSELATSVATALGISLDGDGQFPAIARFLNQNPCLLVIDNCEQLRDSVRSLVETILRSTSRVDILTTSREPLCGRDEHVQAVEPLPYPRASNEIDPGAILEHSAVRLLFQRAGVDLSLTTPTPSEVRAAGSICERLDGMPLAIELAAAHINVFGMEGLVNALDDAMLLSSRGHRTAAPRHQSLRQTMDWSYRVLPERLRQIFARLGVFRGPFTAEYARSVVGREHVDELEDALRSLTAKSLLSMVRSDGGVKYNMLRLTRAYADEKLREAKESDAVKRRHAEFYQLLFEQAEISWNNLTRKEWVDRYRHTIDDVRAALDWCFGEGADPATGASLLAATLPFGYQLSAIGDFKRRSELAIRIINETGGNDRAKLRLTLALRTIALNAVSDPRLDDNLLEDALDLAAKFSIPALHVEPLLLLTICRIEQGQYDGAVAATVLLEKVAESAGDPLAMLLAQRAAAQAAHYSGDHARGRELATRVINHPAISIPLIYSQASVDRRVSMNIIRARIDWVEGFADRAADVIGETLELASHDGPFSICQALALAGCPIALWRGDLDVAEERVGMLEQQAARYGLDRWHRLAQGYSSVLARRVRQGTPSEAPWLPVGRHSQDLLISVDEQLILHADSRCDPRTPSGWCAPELMRAAAGRLPNDRGREAQLRDSVAASVAQGTLAWELRSATSLARLLVAENRAGEAQTLLSDILARMPEGRGTSDVEIASSLLKGIDAALAELHENDDSHSTVI